MKFNFKIQQYQTEAVDAVVRVFNGQPHYDKTSYIRDLGKKQILPLLLNVDEDDPYSETGYKNEAIELTDAQLLENIRAIQAETTSKCLISSSVTSVAVLLILKWRPARAKPMYTLKLCLS